MYVKQASVPSNKQGRSLPEKNIFPGALGVPDLVDRVIKSWGKNRLRVPQKKHGPRKPIVRHAYSPPPG